MPLRDDPHYAFTSEKDEDVESFISSLIALSDTWRFIKGIHLAGVNHLYLTDRMWFSCPLRKRM